MNRELKFRVWDGENIVMPNYPFIGAGSSATEICIRIDGQTRIPNAYGLEGSTIGAPRPEIPELVFMQFTGLRDINGNEVYEGDILKQPIEEYNGRFTETVGYGIYEVKYKPDIYMIVGEGEGEWLTLEEFVGAKVVGNIYQNPEYIQ